MVAGNSDPYRTVLIQCSGEAGCEAEGGFCMDFLSGICEWFGFGFWLSRHWCSNGYVQRDFDRCEIVPKWIRLLVIFLDGGFREYLHSVQVKVWVHEQWGYVSMYIYLSRSYSQPFGKPWYIKNNILNHEFWGRVANNLVDEMDVIRDAITLFRQQPFPNKRWWITLNHDHTLGLKNWNHAISTSHPKHFELQRKKSSSINIFQASNAIAKPNPNKE